MSNVRTLQRSFAGGEVSPEMFGRIDDVKYQAGAAKMRNFIAKATGPAENRPGFQFVREVKDSSKAVRLIDFTFSTTQTMVLEMGAGYFRFHTQGATLLYSTPSAWTTSTAYAVGDLVRTNSKNYYCQVAHTSGTFATDLAAGKWYELTTAAYEIPNPYAEADLFDIHYVQSADILTLAHPNYEPRELRRLGATNWTLTTIPFAPSVLPPAAGTVVVTVAGLTTPKYKYQYVVTSIGSDGINESEASLEGLGVAKNISGVTKANPGVLTVASHGLSPSDPVYISGIVGMTELNGNKYFVDTTPDASSLTLKTESGVSVDTTGFGTWTSGGTVTARFIKSNLNETGCTHTITWPAVSGATRYNVYKFLGGIYGYIGSTKTTVLVDDNIAPDMSKTPPTYDLAFSGSGNYPGAVSYYEQRRCFAGTTNKPQNLWMTKSGTESNMSYSLPIRDDDRVAIRVAAREANTIRHIVPLSQLVLLTSSAEWRVSSVNSDAITPSSISVKPQSYIGASNVQPVIVNNNMIYCAARGGHVRECSYNWQANGFITGDLSLRSAHLFDNLGIADMAYAKAPQPVLWFVSSNGKLLGLTYIPEQQVGAWHQHDTDGLFESCTVVAEGAEDVLYVVVKRTIDGSPKRYVERMASRQFVNQEDAFFVDCGLTYDSTPADTISGLDHLEGKTVNILADGAVHPQRVVTDGAIQLDVEASVVQVGLPITADLQTLPLAMQIDSGYGQGRYKNVNKAWLRVFRSSGIFVGPTADLLTEAKQRKEEPYGTPPALKSEEIQVMVTPSWADSGQVFVRQTDPLPLTIVSLTLEVSIGG